VHVLAKSSLYSRLSYYVFFLSALVSFHPSTYRPIPDKPWMLGWGPCFLVGGALPFGACYAELFFVLSSLWTDSYYYLFGFLFLALLLLALTCALVAVLLTYLLLCAEDPRWGWRSFGCAAATGAYVLAYSAVFFSRLEANQTVRFVCARSNGSN